MLLPTERQEKIRELISEHKNMKISDLSKVLGVSEMTIHRDLKPLVDQGFIMKTFGGITLVRKEPGHILEPDDCVLCNRKLNNRFTYKLILKDNTVENTCCPHCGLIRQQQLKEKVFQAICYDFLSGTTTNASVSWFVVATSIEIGCCQPQFLSFSHYDHAQKFIKGFGGKVLSMKDVLTYIQNGSFEDNCCVE
jgi:DeoR family transcriptional regulator, copper-sensing transcriptional repressor